MMKKLILLLMGVFILSILSGCEDGQGSGGTNASNEVKTLEVLWFSDGGEGDSFLKLAEEYSEEHPNVKIELNVIPFAGFDDALREMVSEGKQPDMARMTDAGSFRSDLIDLFEYTSAGRSFSDNFTDALPSIYDGKMVAAPMDVTANGIIYNKTAFDQAGVSMPQTEEEIWTWEEWRQAMVDVIAGSDVTYGLALDKSPHRLSTLWYEAGASMLTPDLSESNFNTPEMQRTISFVKDLSDEGIMTPAVWTEDANASELFRNGEVAMHLAGNWMIGAYKDISDFEWGITYLPKDVQRATTPGGKWLGAFQGTGVEQEAADFIEWISHPEINAQYCTENYFLSPVIGNESLDYDFGTEFFEIFAQDLAATPPQPGKEWVFRVFIAMVQNDIRDEMLTVLAGEATVEEFIQSIDEKITAALEEIL